jgi:hypothetical protein
MRAFIVSVDYAGELAVTLPYNRHHFSDVVVVTTPDDKETIKVAEENNAFVYPTTSFYARRAKFNKWAALEETMSATSREGWITLMDADVLWPKEMNFRDQYSSLQWWNRLHGTVYYERGELISPLRHMMLDVPQPFTIPPESEWGKFPIHRNVNEWAGYSQIFHGSDPVLGEPPWHKVNYYHAGTADSLFQAKWRPENKIRTPWNCLHIGLAGVNWCGRSSRRMDGSLPEDSQERLHQIAKIWEERRGKVGAERFKQEELE